MELSTSVPGGSSRRGSVFGALARRAFNVTPVVSAAAEVDATKVDAPTDITGTHTRTTMVVKTHNLMTEREQKIRLQERVDAAEDRVRDLRKQRAIKSVEGANGALQARPDLLEQWEGEAEKNVSPVTSPMQAASESAAIRYGYHVEPPTPSSDQKRWLDNLVDNEHLWPGVPDDLKADKSFMMRATAANGRALEFASPSLKEDRQLVLTAVAQSGVALKHACPAFQADRAICLRAVEQHGEALEFASPELKANGAFVAEASERDFRAWAFASDLDRESIIAAKPLLVRARQKLAQRHLSLPPDEQKTKEYNGGFYTPYYGALNAALADDSTALVYANYIVGLDDSKQPLQHRRDLPDEAIYYGPLWSDYDGEYGAGILVVALSYLWASAEEPDPKGVQLRDLAHFLRWLMRSDRCKRTKVVVFMDWISLYIDKPPGSRTPDQTSLFESGLANVHKWFVHPNTLSLLSKRTPKGRHWDFDCSGWPVFERAVSNMAKEKDQVLDMTAALVWLRDQKMDGEFKENGVPMDTKGSYGKLIGALEFATDKPLPQSAERFGSDLQRMHFSVPEDADLILRKYTELFGELTKKIGKLKFHRMSTSSEEWLDFVHNIVPVCTGVEVLNLSSNRSLSINIADLVNCCPATLRELVVDDTSCEGNGLAASWRKLPRLQSVSLVRSLVTGSKEELELVLPVRCKVQPGLGAKTLDYRRHGFTTPQWVEFISDILPLCNGLEWLHLDDNAQLVVDIQELVKGLPITLKELSVSFTGCYGKGLEAQWSELPQLYLLDLEGTNVTGPKEGLKALLPFGCQVTAGLGAKQLFYNARHRTIDEWMSFITSTLPLCTGLEELFLDDNPSLKVDISVVIAHCPCTLIKLSMDNTALFGDGDGTEWEKVSALEFLSLRGNPDLVMDIVSTVEVLPVSLREIFLRDTNCFGEGIKASWKRLENLEWVHIDGSKITGTEEELEEVLPDGCYAFVDKKSTALRRTSLLPSSH